MDLGVISVRYARALLKSAIAEKQEYELYQSMQSLAESYVNVPELRFTIDNPMLSKEAKQTVLESTYKEIHRACFERGKGESLAIHGCIVYYSL